MLTQDIIDRNSIYLNDNIFICFISQGNISVSFSVLSYKEKEKGKKEILIALHFILAFLVSDKWFLGNYTNIKEVFFSQHLKNKVIHTH